MSEKSPVEIGNQYEEKTRRVLQREFKVSVVNGGRGNTDLFGLADVIVCHPEHGIRLLQIKVNRFGWQARQKYLDRIEDTLPKGQVFEVWVWNVEDVLGKQTIDIHRYDWQESEFVMVDSFKHSRKTIADEYIDIISG